MDRNYYDKDDFEEFLKQKADQYKIYPADRVWNNIYRSLHHPGRWISLALFLFLSITSLLIGKNSIPVSFSGTKAARPETAPPAPAQGLQPRRLMAALPRQAGNRGIVPVTGTQHGLSSSRQELPLTGAADVQAFPVVAPDDDADVATRSYAVLEPTLHRVAPAVIVPARLRRLNTEEPAAGPGAVTPPSCPTTSRLMFQLYASSMISYRRLTSDNLANTGAPVSAQYAGNVNSYVHHKPAAGFEIGGKVLYPLSDNLTVYAGAQLNYSRYYIDAFSYRQEKASIALNNNSFVPDTLSGYTSIRNLSGYAPEQLQNQYWQLSVPLGLEIALLGHGKLQFNIGGGLQPTVLLNSNAYLISSDYKNYLQSPDLARRFNVHTNFEAFVSYRAGGMKWQLGPQFRSQLLSSYSTQYKVKEYLTEFGIKFAISRSAR